MLFDELKTTLPFYDDIDKQNRYRTNCLNVCQYRHIYPENNIPNFQIVIPKNTVGTVSNLYIRCAEDDSILVDLITYVGPGSVIWGFVNGSIDTSLTDGDYFTYDGVQAAGSEITGLSCGEYYLEMVFNAADPTDPDVNYYSEVFTIITEVSGVTFVQSDPPIFTLWRWHDAENKLNANKSNCAAVCDFYLNCGVDALLPFMFRANLHLSVGYTMVWSLIEEDSECEIFLDTTLINVQTPLDGYDYIYYNGGTITPDLPCGYYYSKLNIDGNIFYSEPIYINVDINTPITDYILQETGFRILLETGFGTLQE